MSGPLAPPPPSADRNGRRATRMRTGIEVVGRVGTLVALAAMLVLAATAGALVDGMPAGGTVTATFEH
jgi:hypothetical protein